MWQAGGRTNPSATPTKSFLEVLLPNYSLSVVSASDDGGRERCATRIPEEEVEE